MARPVLQLFVFLLAVAVSRACYPNHCTTQCVWSSWAPSEDCNRVDGDYRTAANYKRPCALEATVANVREEDAEGEDGDEYKEEDEEDERCPNLTTSDPRTQCVWCDTSQLGEIYPSVYAAVPRGLYFVVTLTRGPATNLPVVSAPCGGTGTRMNSRVLVQHGSCEMSKCDKEEFRRDNCTTPCFNGVASAGKCECDPGYSGTCCEIGETLNEKSCQNQGGLCIDSFQLCDGGHYIYDLCGENSGLGCCVRANMGRPTPPAIQPDISPSTPPVPPSKTPPTIPSENPYIASGKTPPTIPSENPYIAPNKTPPTIPSDNPYIAPSKTPPAIPSENPYIAPGKTPPAIPNEIPPLAPSETPPLTHPSTPPKTLSTAPYAPPRETPPTTPRVTPHVALLANQQCKDSGGFCRPYWSECSGGQIWYGLCGEESIYECCMPDRSATTVAPTWDKMCKAQNGSCLIAWKTACVGDVIYGKCGDGGHECCVSNLHIAADDENGKCHVRGGHCVARGAEMLCSGDCWSNFCGRGDAQLCCIPDSELEDFLCVQLGGRCQSSDTCEGGQYRRGLCAGYTGRKCCIAGLQPLASTFPAGTCSNVRIVSRSAWGAEQADKSLTPMTLPVKRLVIHHTGYPACHGDAACQGQMRKIQLDEKKSKHLADISYNFLVGDDGQAYVGRGWGYVGADGRSDTVSIAAMGDFDSDEPSEKMITAMADLIDCAVQQGILDANFEMFAQRQVACTVSPGKYMCDVIKTSSHYSSSPTKFGC